MNLYAFKFQHPRSAKYVWLLVFGPFAVVFPVVFLTDFNLAAALVAVFGSIGLGFYLLYTKGKACDEISLDRNGFTSAFFGRVEFDDIKQVNGRSLFMDPPSMRIELHSGRKLTWRITSKGSMYNSVADAETFLRFTTDLSRIMDARPAAKTDQKPLLSYEDAPPAEQLREVVKRNGKPALAIPVGAAFALLALVKTCGKDWFKRDEVNFAEIAAQQEKKYESNIEAAKAVMAGHLKKQGPHFLYTNDTAARAELLPDIEVSDATGIAAFRHTGANKELEAFIQNPDSFTIQTVIVAADGSAKPMSESILNMNDSAGIKLFIRFYDPSQHMVPPRMRSTVPIDSAMFPVFDMSTAIAIYDSLHLAAPISDAVPGMRMMLAQARHRPSFRIYLTGGGKDGVTETLFHKAVRELNKQMTAVKADTGRFVLKTYNR